MPRPALPFVRGAVRQYTYFPISLEAFGAATTYYDLVEETFMAGDIQVTTMYLNHPALTLAYKLQADGATVVYCTDHEPFDKQLAYGGSPGPGSADERHAEFFCGANLLIHDWQYRAEEYAAKAGWGHSTLEYVVDMAVFARVERVALFHHDPMRTDEQVDKLVADANERAMAAHHADDNGQSCPPELFGASDQGEDYMEVIPRTKPGRQPLLNRLLDKSVSSVATGSSVEEDGGTPASPHDFNSGAAATKAKLSEDDVVRITGAMSTPAVAVLLEDSAVADPIGEALVAEDSIRGFFAKNEADLMQLLETQFPTIVLVQKGWQGVADAGITLARRIRDKGVATQSAYLQQLCVIVVCEDGVKCDESTARAAGMTDWLVKPFTAVYARTRLRAQLLRVRGQWQRALEDVVGSMDEAAAVTRISGGKASTATAVSTRPGGAGGGHALRATNGDGASLASLEISDACAAPSGCGVAPGRRHDKNLLASLASSLFQAKCYMYSTMHASGRWIKVLESVDDEEQRRDIVFINKVFSVLVPQLRGSQSVHGTGNLAAKQQPAVVSVGCRSGIRISHSLDLPPAAPSEDSNKGSTYSPPSGRYSLDSSGQLGDGVLHIPDTMLDPRFAADVLTMGKPRVRMFAAVPLRSQAQELGYFCVVDARARKFEVGEMKMLQSVADLVVQMQRVPELAVSLGGLLSSSAPVLDEGEGVGAQEGESEGSSQGARKGKSGAPSKTCCMQ
eukprot:jgi/Mesvir1/10641/Mv13737-RA.1